MSGHVGEMSGPPERIETIVIGGGQTGLAVGAVGTTLARARRRLVEAHDRQNPSKGIHAAHS